MDIQKIMDLIMDSVDSDDFETASKELSKLGSILGPDNTEYKKMAGIINDALLIYEL